MKTIKVLLKIEIKKLVRQPSLIFVILFMPTFWNIFMGFANKGEENEEFYIKLLFPMVILVNILMLTMIIAIDLNLTRINLMLKHFKILDVTKRSYLTSLFLFYY